MTEVRALPRGWKTPVTFHTNSVDVGLRDEFGHLRFARPGYGDLLAGINLCPNGQNDYAFCTGDWNPVFTRFHDPKGPFDGWFWLDSEGRVAKIRLNRVGFLNPWLAPNGPAPAPGQPRWYDYNAAHGVDVKDFRLYTIEHEGWGFGPELSGHMQALVAAIRDEQAHNDPRRYLETRVGQNETELHEQTLKCVADLDLAAFDYAKDNLVPAPEQPFAIFAWYGKPLKWRGYLLAHDPPLDPRTLTLPSCADG
jgi:hypothetical protein